MLGVKANLHKLTSCDDSKSDVDVIETIETMLREVSSLRVDLVQLKEEELRMATDAERQLGERDRAHSEIVRSLEIVMAEKEKQMLQSSNLLRQQLAESKSEIQKLQRQQLENSRRIPTEVSLDQEMNSLVNTT